MARRPTSGKTKGGQRGGIGYGGSGGGDDGGSSGDGGGEGRGPFREDEGAVRVHEAYLEHRLGGGVPATPQAYLRALRQFQKLPGAVRSTPAGASPETSQEESGDDDGDKR